MTERSSTVDGPHRRPVLVRGGLAVALAVAINVIFVTAVGALDIAPGFQALTVPPVAILSALGASGATIVYWLCARYLTDGDRTFLRVAIAVLILSFLPDIALLRLDPAATLLGVIVLMIMHVVVAVVSIALLVYWGKMR